MRISQVLCGTSNIGANDPVICDVLVGDTEVVRPFLCVREPTALRIPTCPAVGSHSINDDNVSAERAVVERGVLIVETIQHLVDDGFDFGG